MTGAALAAGGALLAACTPAAVATAQPTASPSAPPSTGPTSAPPATPSATATAAPSYAVSRTSSSSTGRPTSAPTTRRRSARPSGSRTSPRASIPRTRRCWQAQGRRKGAVRLAVPTAEFSKTLADGGFLEKLDKCRLPNLATVNKRFLTLPFDPNDDYIVPKDWGTTGIIYRGKKVKEPITSWKDFWDLATTTYWGKTFVLDSPGDVFVAPFACTGST